MQEFTVAMGSKYYNKNKEISIYIDHWGEQKTPDYIHRVPSSEKVRKPGVVFELQLKLNLHREFNHYEQVIMINHTK